MMTEEQMRQRIREINREQNKLRAEKQEYERCLIAKKEEEEKKSHEIYVGKCYLTKGLANNQNGDIKAFKILKQLEDSESKYVQCLVVIEGCRGTCYGSYGVEMMVLNPWSQNKPQLLGRDDAPKMIDFYSEISQEEFENLCKSHMQVIENELIKKN